MSENNCVFCQIIEGKAPAEIVYRDDQVIAFRDQHPAAPVHLLIIPVRHIPSLNRISEDDATLLGHLIIVTRKMAEQYHVSQSGYRFVINTGPNAGQSIFHLHAHLMGGRPLPGMAH